MGCSFERQKRLQLLMHLKKFLDESEGHKESKIRIDKDSEFYNWSGKS